MATAHPLLPVPDDGLDVAPLDLAEFSAEGRAAVEQAELRVAAGTAVLVPYAEIEEMLEEQRRRHAG